MKKEVKIGIIAVVIILASWAGIRFLGGMDIFGRSNTYKAYYENVQGLQNAAPVVIQGVKVGQVTNITLASNGKVEVEFTVDRKHNIPDDSQALMFSAGLMGGRAIEICLGSSSSNLENGGTLQGGVKPDMFDNIGSVIDDLKGKLGTLLDNVNNTVSDVDSLVVDNRAAAKAMISNLNKIIADLEASGIVENIDAFSKTLKDSGPRIDSLVSNVNTITEQFAERNLAAELSTVLAEVKGMLDQLNKGEGSVGKLLKDEGLYKKLDDAAKHLSALLADVKENPKRYINIRVFGNSPEEKQALKEAKEKEKAEKKAAKEAKKN